MKENTVKSALLLMDLQTTILSSLPNKAAYISSINQAIGHARKQHLPLLFVRVGFRKNAPEINVNNKMFGGFKKQIMGIGEENFLTLEPTLDRKEDDIIITKRRVSAFSGSDLDVVLRAQNINHLVLAGIATSGVVLSTLREAADMDFHLTVLADGCADRDPEVHRVLTEKIFPKQADVITIEEWIRK